MSKLKRRDLVGTVGLAAVAMTPTKPVDAGDPELHEQCP
jgi:hypothetical protein